MSTTHGFMWTDVAGLSLSSEDKEILQHPFVSGVILFSRNFESVSQLRELTAAITAVSPRLVITVDQEGGRVQRFRDGFSELPSMGAWGCAYEASPEKTRPAFSQALKSMVSELRNVGIYSTLVPVLDIDHKRNAVIGHRSFGSTAELVTTLSAFMIDELHALNMPVTGKHFPGHGFVSLDSHLALPVDERSWEAIFEKDLQPFLTLSSQLDAIMLAHIVYEQLDAMPVCFSRFWVQDVLRARFGYQGLIMSDDLSMQGAAFIGGYEDRATAALEAGCDVLLVCNNRAGVVEIMDRVVSKKNQDAMRRIGHYARFLV